MEDYDLVVKSDADWEKFPLRGFETVVDPMVFRSADVFLRGEVGATKSLGRDRDTLWGALSANIGSLTAFFDVLLLSERLPIIDYGTTFDNELAYDVQPLRDRINAVAEEQLIESVHVMMNATESARKVALDTLEPTRHVDDETRENILKELSAFDHEWHPDVSFLNPKSDEDERLLQFAYGGRLFSEFASRANVAHLLQPKRSHLYLKLSVGGDASDEDALFEALRTRLAAQEEDAELLDIDGLPSFLPYLLSDRPRSPSALLEAALALRKTGAVKDYRFWRVALLREWRERRRIDRQVVRDLKSAARSLANEFEPRQLPASELKLTLAGLSGSVALPVQSLLGWAASKFPGRRHTMLLMRMAAARLEYETLDIALEKVWQGKG